MSMRVDAYADNGALNKVFTAFAVEHNEDKRISLFTDFFNLLTQRVFKSMTIVHQGVVY